MGSAHVLDDWNLADGYGIHNVVTTTIDTSADGRSCNGENDGVFACVLNVLYVIVPSWIGYLLGMEQRINDHSTVGIESY